MRRLLALAFVATVVLSALPVQPASAAGLDRCTGIVVDRPAGEIWVQRLVVTKGVSCRLAHDIGRRVAKGREDRENSRRYRGWLCDLVSDRQLECDKGKLVIGFEYGTVKDGARPKTCADTGPFTTIQRSPRLGCASALKLLRAANGVGSLPSGWRCTNGPSGTSCWKLGKSKLNFLSPRGTGHRFAVTADTA